jgi:glycosyltransferase involved in cell wall biosynthesis
VVSVTGQIKWLQGVWPDGWIEVRAFLRLRAVKRLEIRAFLPASSFAEVKSVSFLDGDDLLLQADLVREAATLITLDLDERHENAVLLVQCNFAEPEAHATDKRALGFVCANCRVNDGDWMDIPTYLAAADRVKEDLSYSLQEYVAIEQDFEAAFYRGQFSPNEHVPSDLIHHYLTIGAAKGRDPCSWFSTSFYLAQNPDVAEAGINPFAHFLSQGRKEGRAAKPPEPQPPKAADVLEDRDRSRDVFAERQKFTGPGPGYEDLDPSIVKFRAPAVKAFAYYLPQFHPFAENDAWWGKGFTEWRNVVRGQPRYTGHYQPRVPRDLGFYDLRRPGVFREQMALARAAGIFGFCFYYYFFTGRRLLEQPVDAFLADRSLDMPFALMWANENWTRTWDGHDREVLMSQDYRAADEDALLADLARHFDDPRYYRIDGRPLFFIYRPSLIPDSAKVIARWRQKLESQHGLRPLLFMAQGFDDYDPRPHGLDGAIEFPPHKLGVNLPAINHRLDILDPGFTGHVIDYNAIVGRSLDEAVPEFPLIRTVTPSWDNECRRPGRGMTMQGATPEAYRSWLAKMVDYAAAHPVLGERIVAINAWNEWAEGAYLEPDVYYGSAYLNATARALTRSPSQLNATNKVLIVGHDAYRHGAQMLVANLATVMSRQFGAEVTVLVCGEGPMLSEYNKICDCMTVTRGDQAALKRIVSDLKDRGYSAAIVNTTVSGWTVPELKAQGFAVCSLIHELKTLIQEYRLERYVADIAAKADHVVFPATMVQESFMELAGEIQGKAIVAPQGLYKTELARSAVRKEDARARLGIPPDRKVVINVGYADPRKGFDIFARVAQLLCAKDRQFEFIWVGDATPDIKRWLLPELTQGDGAPKLRLTGFTNDVADYFAAADVFLLTSREDPFPSVVLEALAAGLPVVGMEGTTGCGEIIASHGRLVARNNIDAMCAAVIKASGKERAAAPEARRRLVREDYRFDEYCFRLMRMVDPRVPRISVIVPNYNYARYLPSRLVSIFNQTHPVLEIIVLDDCSSDDSVDVIRKTAQDAKRTIDLIVNEHNSGSVFRQWRRGAELARGDYVWIAEADDIADERFLETVARAATGGSADIAFCDSWQIGSDGDLLGPSYRSYLNQIEPAAFDSSFTVPGQEFLRRFLSVKNVILNVSGVLWSRKALLNALAACGDDLFKFRVAGDWRLYCEVARAGGAVAYVSNALNGHRRHKTSVTHALGQQNHYAEVLALQKFAGQSCALDARLRRARAEHRANVRQTLGLQEVDDAEPND